MSAVLHTFFAVIGIGTVAFFFAFVALTWVAGRGRRGERAGRQLSGWR